MTTKFIYLMIAGITLALGQGLAAQVQTDVPQVVPGAKPVTVEHIKVHGRSLEGNLEGDAADRDVFVFLPLQLRQGRNPAAIQLCMHCTDIRSAQNSGLTKSMCRRLSKEPSRKALKK